jgi:molecular chaperone Hsp33
MLHLTSLVRHAQSLHGLSAARAEILGQGLLAGVLLASVLEDEERINLRVQASADFTMGIETTRHAMTRGYLEVDPESPLVRAIDDGEHPDLPLVIRSLRSSGHAHSLFEGTTGTRTASLEFALNEHLAASYQMGCKIRMDCWHSPTDQKLYAVGAIFLELPKLKEEVRQALWSHVDALPPLRTLFGESAHDPDAFAQQLIPHTVRAINNLTPNWSCSCSQNSVETMLLKLGQQELLSLAGDKKPAEIRCHYCNKTYVVTEERLAELALSLTTVSSDTPLV